MSAASSREINKNRAPLRVLCIDDNFDVADSEALLLTVMGFEARACYGGADALVVETDFRPDVCLIDLNMPGMSGCEVAAQMRERDSTLMLIAVTARSDEASGRRVLEAGFQLHLVKPVDPAVLIGVLGQIEHKRRAPTPDMNRDAPE